MASEIIQVRTYTAFIYIGTRIAYTQTFYPKSIAEKYLHEYVDKIGLCVSITETKYIYSSNRMSTPVDGEEPGLIIGLLNYPLYPDTAESIRIKAREIAIALKELYEQQKVIIVYPDIT